MEVQQGTDPLDGLPVITGIIASSDTAGTAVDVCALNDLAVLADSQAGVTVFNVQGQNPVRIARVDTPGNALRVACSGSLIGVADGPAGLAIVDITYPPSARIVHQRALGEATAIAATGPLVYVGTRAGEIVAVDLPSGTIIERVSAGGRIHDLAVEGDVLFALIENSLRAWHIRDDELEAAGSVASSGFPAEGITGAKRLFVGGGLAYCTSYPGYDVFDVRDPAAMTRVGNATDSGPNSFKQIVPNGSGLGIAAVGVNPRPDGTHDLYLYDVSEPSATTRFLTALPTPGIARSLSIYNGLAYIADGEAGLQVVNYLAYDSRGTNPAITLSASFPVTGTNGVAEEGKLVRLTAAVTDDVQVRNVEFYLDGARVLTDGNFPFEHRFLTPALAAAKTNFTVRAKATDTGGNFAWSDEVVVALTPDTTPPRLKRTDPPADSVVPAAGAVLAFFNEPLDLATVTPTSLFLVAAGPDGRLGTPDDRFVTEAAAGWRETLNAVVLAPPAPLAPGVYQFWVTTNVTDAAGNAFAEPAKARFAVFATGADGDEDDDGLSNAQELVHGTNPLFRDSDGAEVDDETNPNDPASRPRVTFVARPPIAVDLPSPETAGSAGNPTIVARPPVLVDLPSSETAGSAGSPVFLARPPVTVDLPSPETTGSAGHPTVLARPPVLMDLPSADTAGSGGAPVYFALPPVQIRRIPADRAADTAPPLRAQRLTPGLSRELP